MVFSNEMQIELPNSFPVTLFAEFRATGLRLLSQALFGTKADVLNGRWSEFAGASNLIAWRYRACAEDCSAYVSSWKNAGPLSSSHEERYLRERALFGLFVSGVSCIDSTCYAIYALGSDPRVLGLQFGPEQQRLCNPHYLRRALIPYAGHTRTEQLVRALTLTLKSDEWKVWIDLRNRLAHRSNLPYHSRVAATAGSEGKPAITVQFGKTSSTPQIEADDSKIASLFSWLRPTLESLLEGGCRLAVDR